MKNRNITTHIEDILLKKHVVFDIFFLSVGTHQIEECLHKRWEKNAPHTKNIHRLDRLGLNTGQIDMYIIITYIIFIYTYVVYMI